MGVEERALHRSVRWMVIVSVLFGIIAGSFLLVLAIWASYIWALHASEYVFARLERIQKESESWRRTPPESSHPSPQ